MSTVKITEASFQAQVVALTRLYRLGCYHPYDSRRSQPGWPDLTIWGPDGIIFRELKTTTGRLTTGQQATHASLRHAGGDVAVWRPSDLTNGRISTELVALGRFKAAPQ